MAAVVTLAPEYDPKTNRGMRINVKPVDDTVLIDYEELYDELFFRAEQSIGAQLHPTAENGGDG